MGKGYVSCFIGCFSETILTLCLWLSISKDLTFVMKISIVVFFSHLYRYYLFNKKGFVIAIVDQVAFNLGQAILLLIIFMRIEKVNTDKFIVMDPENLLSRIFGLN